MNPDHRNIPALFPPTLGPGAEKRPGEPIAVLMSGGVDSSVTALLLMDAGWSPVGITMRIPVVSGCGVGRPCCGTEAAFVCRDLGIPHHFVDSENTFRDSVIGPFRQAYLNGETPSPCVDCNTRLKFDLVWAAVEQELGIRHLASGHYARIEKDTQSGAFYLRRAKDLLRDQSYFLYGIAAARLPFLHVPLGAFTKVEVRRMASERGVPVAAKPDSMEICFAAGGDYRGLLQDVPAAPGPICNLEGDVLGQHKGIHHYTIGQRKGLGISSKEGLYVVEILPERNMVVVGPREAAFSSRVSATAVNVLHPGAFKADALLWGKVRSVGEPQSCRITRLDAQGMEVQFAQPLLTPALGQHLVLYDESGTVVAGGVIKSSGEVPA